MFNPDATLLSGGEGATIQAVKGGANNDNDEKKKKKGILRRLANKMSHMGILKKKDEGKDEGKDEEKEDENENEENNNYGDNDEENDEDNEGKNEDENENEDEDEDENENEDELPGTSRFKSKDIHIHVDGIKFEIRRFDDETYVDWKNGNYSEGEKKFMETIDLTEDLLQETFGSEWMEKVADFLKNLVNASCFKDSVLLTKKECEGTREFTKKVHLKLYERLLKKMRGSEPEMEVEEENSNTASVEGQNDDNRGIEENNEGMVEANTTQEGGRRRLPSIGGFRSLHL